MQKIGIIGAMRVEVDALKNLCENPRMESIAGVEYLCGTLFGKDVILAVSGVGKVNAAICTQCMIARYAPDCIINTGVAGGIGKGLAVMDVVIGTRVAQHDMDTSQFGDPIGFISGLNRIYMDCDPRLTDALFAAAQSLCIPTKRGEIVSGDQFIASRIRIDAILANFPKALATEMEGAAIGQVCVANNLPFAVVRAISDGGDEQAHMSYPEFVERSAVRSIDILRALLQS